MRLLQLEGVSKAFGGVRAVNEVTFEVQDGELIGVMGPNGSGKTTLFNLIAGGLAPDSGRIRFRGADVSGWAPHRIARTFQLVRPFMGMSARDNVLVGGLYGRERCHRATAEADADRLLARVGLDGKAHVRAAQLTLIDRKRLELARALATSPSLLLLDEFMAGLNPAETERALALVRELHAEGVTILMVEHIVWALMELSRRIVVLSAGEKIADGTPEAVAADPVVVDVYLGGAGGSPGHA